MPTPRDHEGFAETSGCLKTIDLVSNRAVVRSLAELGPLTLAWPDGPVLVVIAPAFVDHDSVRATITRQLAGRSLEWWSEFTPNPTLEEAAHATRLAIERGVVGVVALGGGTSLDLGKLVAAGAHAARHGLDPHAVLRAEAEPAGALPLIAIPTTAGTGSEATRFAVVYVDGSKRSVASEHLLPSGVVLDRELLRTMPPEVAAASVLDALCQAIESCWAVRADDRSLCFAHAALSTLGPAIDRLAGCLGNTSARGMIDDATLDELLLGAHLAGRAIDLTTTTAAHALSYPITAKFGVPHGVAVALTLGPLAAYNAGATEHDTTDPRGPAAVRLRVADACGVLGQSPERMPAFMRSLLRSLGQPSSLEGAGVARTDLDGIARGVNAQRLGNNPRSLTHEGLRALLDAAFPRTADEMPSTNAGSNEPGDQPSSGVRSIAGASDMPS